MINIVRRIFVGEKARFKHRGKVITQRSKGES